MAELERKLRLAANAENIIAYLFEAKASREAFQLYFFIYSFEFGATISNDVISKELGFTLEEINRAREELIFKRFLHANSTDLSESSFSYKITNFKKTKFRSHKEYLKEYNYNINNKYIYKEIYKEKFTSHEDENPEKSSNSHSEKISLFEARGVAKELYELYPSHCPNNHNRRVAKTSKDREKIVKLIRQRGESTMRNIFVGYINQCMQEEVFFPNLKTFLNNLPDEEEFSDAVKYSKIFDTEKILERGDIIKMLEELEEKECIFVIECSPKGRIIGDREKLLSPKLILKRMKENEKHYKFVRRDI
jgi:hypothetical protein